MRCRVCVLSPNCNNHDGSNRLHTVSHGGQRLGQSVVTGAIAQRFDRHHRSDAASARQSSRRTPAGDHVYSRSLQRTEPTASRGRTRSSIAAHRSSLIENTRGIAGAYCSNSSDGRRGQILEAEATIRRPRLRPTFWPRRGLETLIYLSRSVRVTSQASIEYVHLILNFLLIIYLTSNRYLRQNSAISYYPE